MQRAQSLCCFYSTADEAAFFGCLKDSKYPNKRIKGNPKRKKSEEYCLIMQSFLIKMRDAKIALNSMRGLKGRNE